MREWTYWHSAAFAVYLVLLFALSFWSPTALRVLLGVTLIVHVAANFERRWG